MTEELAADIFTGEFAPVFLRAARQAAQTMEGSVYARYYDVDRAQIETLKDDKTSLAALCAARAGVQPGRSGAAANGMVLEQQQILTTHNLAQLYAGLDLGDALRGQLASMAQRCLDWSVARYRMKVDGRHARLIRLKQIAYAWRQMLFFLSWLPESEQREFADAAVASFAAQPAQMAARFAPILRGLTLAVAGERLDSRTLHAHGAQRLLGWTTGAHPLLA
ncbi:hypothetical protein [Lysobacter sp. CA199]|uniref:hypothetical protein n=1 Tax=Lysobacter sp. CA199 TaxID=3455608 RepID=UPI003F8D84E8